MIFLSFSIFSPFSSRIRCISEVRLLLRADAALQELRTRSEGYEALVKGDMDSMDLHQKSDQYMKN